MIAVGDTSPLCYLILIGEVEVLPKLFGEVAIPNVVHSELLHPKAPAQVRAWASSLPPWMVVQEQPANNLEGAGEPSSR
jgi:predicted nucleic acid-binding protein